VYVNPNKHSFRAQYIHVLFSLLLLLLLLSSSSSSSSSLLLMMMMLIKPWSDRVHVFL